MRKSQTVDFEIMTREEVAEMLRVKRCWVYEKCRRRSQDPLPVHRIGRYLRFDRAEVMERFGRTGSVLKAKRTLFVTRASLGSG